MSVVLHLVGALFSILRWPLYVLLFICAVFGFLCGIQFFIAFRKGARLKRGEHRRIRRPSLLKNFFYLLPKQYVSDFLDRDPEFFRHQGCIIFTGRQGNGKTIAMAHQALQYKAEYPKSMLLTNFSLLGEDCELDDWRLLITVKNGIQGVVACIDETQNWFSSNQSKNFPPQMLEVITQNRKNRRVILGTAQSFNRLAKPIREQATEVRRCSTFFGCLTIVHRVIPELDSNGDVLRWKHRGWYYFVHDTQLRDSYDTYRVVESLSESGFQPPVPETSVTVTSVVVSKKH